MGNCAGCSGPQRTYKVERLQQNSPIKNRLSNGKFYQQSTSNIKQFSFNQKDKIIDRPPSFNENDIFSGIVGMTQSKSRSTTILNEPYNNQTNDFTHAILSHTMKASPIKLFTNNPQNIKQTNFKQQKSLIYQKQEDVRNSKYQSLKKQNSYGFSNDLLKSVQTQSKRYLRESTVQQRTPLKTNENNLNMSEIKMSSMGRSNGFQSPPPEANMPRFDDISSIRSQKMNKHNYDFENSLPLKKFSKYPRDLSIIQQILQEDHKTPLDVKLERKRNGQDIIYDAFEGFPEQIEPLQIPNLQKYLSALKLVAPQRS